MLYNEIDPFAAAWLEDLMRGGHLPQAELETRSIEDLCPDDLSAFVQCHFFAGIGVWPYALQKAGWPQEVVTWSGSCPCQPFSAAGKGAGFADERHLWPAWSWLVAQCRPGVLFGEQVASGDGKAWLDLVFTDLEALGYTCGAVSWCACGVGAPHIRKRLYWVAHRLADTDGLTARRHSQGSCGPEGQAWNDASGNRSADGSGDDRPWANCEWLPCSDGKTRPAQRGIRPLADGLAASMGTLRGYGNALVAPQAEEFIRACITTIL